MSIDSLKEQARRHERDEEWRKALDLYLKAIERLDGADEPDVSIFNRAADLRVRLGDLEGALKLYDRAIDLYIEADLPNNAIAICRKIGRHVPEQVEVFRRMGQIRALQGFSVDARQNYLTYAEILQTRGEVDEALEALRELVERIPGDWESRILLAEGLLKQDGKDEAVSQLQAAWTHLMQEGSDPERADTLRDRILELDPEVILETPAPASGESPWVDEGSGEGGVQGFEATGLDALDGFESGWEPDTAAEIEFEPEVEVDSGEGDSDLGSGHLPEEEGTPFHEEEVAFTEEGGPSADTPAEEFPGDEILFQEILPESGPEPGEAPASEGLEEDEEALETGGQDAPEEDLPFLTDPESGSPVEVPYLESAHEELDLVDEESSAGAIEARRQEVEEAYRTEDRERLIPALLALAEALSDAGDLEAESVFAQLLQLDPGNPRALAALGRSSPFDGPLSDLSTEEGPEDQDQGPLGEISDAAWMDLEIPEGGDTVDDDMERGITAAPDPASEGLAVEEEEDPAYVDLGSMILDDSRGERTTRWTVAAEEPSGDEGADFARMLSQFKAKVAANLEGEDARSQYDLGTAYKEMGLLDEAISMFQKALRMEPGHLASIEMLGQCFLDRNEPQVAIRVLGRGVKGNDGPEDDLVGIYYFLGQAYEAAGNPDEAREFYEKVFALDINFRDVTDRLRVLR
jgi:tetratricopeptide (TPR) repeat protein